MYQVNEFTFSSFYFRAAVVSFKKIQLTKKNLQLHNYVLNG